MKLQHMKSLNKYTFVGLLILVLVLASGLLAGCTAKSVGATAANSNKTAVFKEKGPKPVVTLEMSDGKKIEIELYPTAAPNTVNNFISLVNKGYYDGLTFHRVIKGFMIQGGDPSGDGSGGPGYSIKGEFTENNFTNNLKHTAGVISMARRGDPERDSAGSQFFIMHKDNPDLDNKYAAFGKVKKGMEVVDAIAGTKTGPGDRPETPVVIKKATVKLNGYVAKKPEIIK